MITSEDIDFLANFYKKLNEKNGNKLDLDAFIEEDGVKLSFQEDIIDNLNDSIARFSEIIKSMKTINLNKKMSDMVFDRTFVESTVKLYILLGELSIVFEDFQKLETKITESLPEGPQDDSELV